jgi:hypothetical protein
MLDVVVLCCIVSSFSKSKFTDHISVKLQRELERGEYVVDEILAKKKIDGKVKYLVRFVGYPEPEWVSAQKSFAPAIQKFNVQAKQQPQAQKKLPAAVYSLQILPQKKPGNLLAIGPKQLVHAIFGRSCPSYFTHLV